MMTSFNLINARCIHNEVNVFVGIHRNIYFIALWLVMVFTQVKASSCSTSPFGLLLDIIGRLFFRLAIGHSLKLTLPSDPLSEVPLALWVL